MRYGPPPASVFQKPEHEFLRVATMASPDWDALRSLSVDWQKLQQLAASHQLEGILAWRLASPEMDGVVGEATRQECRDRLDALARENAWWPGAVQRVVDALKSTSLPLATFRHPVPALLYPGLHPQYWPRSVRHFDPIVYTKSPGDVANANAALAPLADGSITPGAELTGTTFRTRDGLPVTLVIGPGWTGGWSCQEMSIGTEGVTWQSVYGADLPVMAPEASACLRAFATWIDFCGGNPLPIGSTAHLCNLAPQCDRSTYGRVLDHMKRGHEHWTSLPASELVASDAIVLKDHPELLALARGSDLAGVWWGMRYARALYPSIPEWFVTDIELTIGQEPEPHQWAYDHIGGQWSFKEVRPPRAWRGDEVETSAHEPGGK